MLSLLVFSRHLCFLSIPLPPCQLHPGPRSGLAGLGVSCGSLPACAVSLPHPARSSPCCPTGWHRHIQAEVSPPGGRQGAPQLRSPTLSWDPEEPPSCSVRRHSAPTQHERGAFSQTAESDPQGERTLPQHRPGATFFSDGPRAVACLLFT